MQIGYKRLGATLQYDHVNTFSWNKENLGWDMEGH